MFESLNVAIAAGAIAVGALSGAGLAASLWLALGVMLGPHSR